MEAVDGPHQRLLDVKGGRATVEAELRRLSLRYLDVTVIHAATGDLQRARALTLDASRSCQPRRSVRKWTREGRLKPLQGQSRPPR